jgi:hypothetical protein
MPPTTKQAASLCERVFAELAVRLFPRHLNVCLLGSASAATVRACLAYALQLRVTRMFLETPDVRGHAVCLFGLQTLVVFSPDRLELKRRSSVAVDEYLTGVTSERTHQRPLDFRFRFEIDPNDVVMASPIGRSR